MMAGIVRPPALLGVVALCAVLALADNGVGTSKAQEGIIIKGDVVNGTQGAGSFAVELPVLLLISAKDGTLAGTGQTTTDAGGQFNFDQVSLIEEGIYNLGVEYAGVMYRTSLTAQELEDDLHLTVYETTEDVSVLAVIRQLMVVSNVDEESRQVAATELLDLVNRSDQTLLPAPLGSGRMSFLRFSLPSQATELSVRSDLPPGEVISVGTGFALTSPVAPGDHAVEFSYLFPYGGDRASYPQNLPQGAEIYQVLVPEHLPEVQVTGLEPVGLVNISGSKYHVWEGRNFPPGRGPSLVLANLPQPGLLTRLKNSFTDDGLWRNAIPIVVGAALACLLLFGVFKAPRRGEVQGGPVPRNSLRDRSRALVQQIAELDERYQRGEVAEERYQRERQWLASRYLEPSGAFEGGAEEPSSTSNQGGC